MDSSTLKKINIYIAKRDRDEQLENCLFYLNEANKARKYLITVFITEDKHTHVKRESRPIYDHLAIIWSYCRSEILFNKSKLLNHCIKLGNNAHWDWFSIVDLDMVYPETWFDLIEKTISAGNDYIVCHGWKLNEGTQETVNKHLKFSQLVQLPKEELAVGPSQITVTRQGYEILKKYFPESLYNEEFRGWGGEDSILDCKSTTLYLQGKLVKIELPQIWLHMWHPLVRGEADDYAKNFKLYKQLSAEIQARKF